MTDILPPAGWPNVRQLETNEFATGGSNGNMNEQAKSLAARSELLKQYAALPYESKTGGYALNERVQLATGDIVRSTIPSNVNNPNENMTGWVNLSEHNNLKNRDMTGAHPASSISYGTGAVGDFLDEQEQINKDNGLNINFEQLVSNMFTDIERINILNFKRDNVFRKSNLVLPADGITIIEDAAGQTWIREFDGVVRTSSFSTDQLKNAINAANMLNYKVIVDTNITSSEHIDVPESVGIEFVKGGKLTLEGPYQLRLASYASLLNGDVFKSVGGYNIGVRISSGSVGAAVVNSRIEAGTPIVLNNCKSAIISSNKLKNNNGYMIFNDAAEDCQIIHNICTANGGWGMQSSGKQINNMFNGNRIIGDGVIKTGIINIASNAVGSPYTPNLCYGNIVSNNTVTDISEEGISFDWDVTLERRTVKSVGAATESQVIRYLDTDDILTVSGFQSIVALSGAAAGRGARAKGGTDRVVYANPYSFRKLADGDKIGLGFTALNNIIQNNRVERCQRNGIMLYGGNTGTVVDGNTVINCGWGDEFVNGGRWTPYRWGGIGVFSLSRAQVAPTQGVIVTNNKLIGNKHAIDIGVARWEGTDVTPPANIQTSGNTYVDNGTDLTDNWSPA